jgi:hypothetical protein
MKFKSGSALGYHNSRRSPVQKMMPAGSDGHVSLEYSLMKELFLGRGGKMNFDGELVSAAQHAEGDFRLSG